MDGSLTDEQLVAVLDAASERIAERRSADFDAMAEAVRAGSIFARDQRQYNRWRQRTRRPSAGRAQSSGLVGAALERAVMGLRATHPEYVVVGPS
jgi:hypothetical protein